MTYHFSDGAVNILGAGKIKSLVIEPTKHSIDIDETTMSDAKEQFTKSIEEHRNDPKREEPEQDLWEGKYSPKAMFGRLLAAGVVTIGTVVVFFMLPFLYNSPFAVWAALIILLLVWAYLLGLLSYRMLANHYILTSQRFKHRDGILVRTMNRIELLDISDVTYRQGPVEIMLDVGDIVINSSDASHPELILRGISQVRTIADQIDNARRIERRRRGLHIASI